MIPYDRCENICSRAITIFCTVSDRAIKIFFTKSGWVITNEKPRYLHKRYTISTSNDMAMRVILDKSLKVLTKF